MKRRKGTIKICGEPAPEEAQRGEKLLVCHKDVGHEDVDGDNYLHISQNVGPEEVVWRVVR